MRVIGLPSQCFRFIQRQAQQAIVHLERFADFGLNGLPHPCELTETFLAGSGTAAGKAIDFVLS